MLISRYVTIFMIPTAFMLTIFDYLKINFFQSVIGAFFGYFLLYIISKIFLFLTNKEGMGEGDFEVIALIGSFTGIMGCWISLLLGSILGSSAGILLIITNQLNNSKKIPFGPFLAAGAIIYTLFQNEVLSLLFNI